MYRINIVKFKSYDLSRIFINELVLVKVVIKYIYKNKKFLSRCIEIHWSIITRKWQIDIQKCLKC